MLTICKTFNRPSGEIDIAFERLSGTLSLQNMVPNRSILRVLLIATMLLASPVRSALAGLSVAEALGLDAELPILVEEHDEGNELSDDASESAESSPESDEALVDHHGVRPSKCRLVLACAYESDGPQHHPGQATPPPNYI